MKTASYLNNINYNDNKPAVEVLLESNFSKEIRILLKAGQSMKEHKTPYAIVVHLLEGELDFGVNGFTKHLKGGDIISLDGNTPHDLLAKTDCIVRLTLSKYDKAERVEEVAKTS